MPVRKRTVLAEGSFDELIQDATHGDLIEVCSLRREQMDFRPCLHGVMEYVEGEGFYLNGELLFSHQGECINWLPYNGTGILVIQDKKILYLSGDKNAKPEEVHSNGPITECQPHLYTERVVVQEKRSPHHLLIRPHEISSLKWNFQGFKRLPWKRAFAIRHVQKIDIPDPTPFHCGHPEGITFLTEGKFILVTITGSGDLVRKELHKPTREHYKNDSWLACAQGIVDLSDPERLYFNEDLAEPFYEGSYTEVIPTPSGCAVIHGHNIFLPYVEKPFFHFPFDEALAHPCGLLLLRGLECFVLVLT